MSQNNTGVSFVKYKRNTNTEYYFETEGVILLEKIGLKSALNVIIFQK